MKVPVAHGLLEASGPMGLLGVLRASGSLGQLAFPGAPGLMGASSLEVPGVLGILNFCEFLVLPGLREI